MSGLTEPALRHYWPQLVSGATTAAGVVPDPAQSPQTVLPEERRAAREQGYSEGLKLGREAAATEATELLARLEEVLREAAQQSMTLQRNSRAQFGELTRWLAAELGREALAATPEFLDRLLDEAMELAGFTAQGIEVALAPDLFASWAELETRRDLRVQSDDSLGAGEIQLRTEQRLARFSMAELVERGISVLSQQAASADQDADAEPRPGPAPSLQSAPEAGAGLEQSAAPDAGESP